MDSRHETMKQAKLCLLGVTYNAGKRYADHVNATFVETSAKTGKNIEMLFQEIGGAKIKEVELRC